MAEDPDLPPGEALRRADVEARTSTEALQKNLLPPISPVADKKTAPKPKKKKPKAPKSPPKPVAAPAPAILEPSLAETASVAATFATEAEKQLVQSCPVTYDVPDVGDVPCDVECWASEPFTILTNVDVRCVAKSSGETVAEASLSVAEITLDYGGREYIATQDWDDAFDLQEILVKMFKEADDDGSGCLSYEEFFTLMEEADLGINKAELRLLMAEADEDDDGSIDYREFMPIALDLIHSFKARKSAKKAQDAEQRDVDARTQKKLRSPELEAKVAQAEALFQEADGRSTGVLTRPEFRRYLKRCGVELTKGESNMVMATMPVDAFSKVVYSKFREILFKVKYTTIRNEILEARATDTAKVLLPGREDRRLRDASCGPDRAVSRNFERRSRVVSAEHPRRRPRRRRDSWSPWSIHRDSSLPSNLRATFEALCRSSYASAVGRKWRRWRWRPRATPSRTPTTRRPAAAPKSYASPPPRNYPRRRPRRRRDRHRLHGIIHVVGRAATR